MEEKKYNYIREDDDYATKPLIDDPEASKLYFSQILMSHFQIWE